MTSWILLIIAVGIPESAYVMALALKIGYFKSASHDVSARAPFCAYYLGLELLLLGLGLGKGLGLGIGLGLGVGLDTYKTIFMKVSSAPVAQW